MKPALDQGGGGGGGADFSPEDLFEVQPFTCNDQKKTTVCPSLHRHSLVADCIRAWPVARPS